LTGKEQFNIDIRQGDLKVNEQIKVTADSGKSFEVKVRLDTDVEIEYFKNGGILQYVLRKLAKS
jgi:aconitate hydratase